MGTVYVLGNSATPGGRAVTDTVAAAVRDRGVDPVVLEPTTPQLAGELAQRCVADGADRLIAVGGDGVVNIAVNAVADTDVTLGIVPAGTGNDFARALDLLGGDVEDQVERALSPSEPIDAIRCEHGWIATVATLGFSGDVTARANDLAWPRGQFRYTVATLLQLPRLRTLEVAVDVDGRRFATSTTLLAVGNTPFFGGGMRICPSASPDDGRLDVVSIGAVSRRRFVRVFPTVFKGQHVDRPEVSATEGTVVEIESSAGDPLALWADGELVGPLPVRLEIVSGALQVAGVARRDRS